MPLRTLTFYALYNPAEHEIIAFRQFKYQIMNIHHPAGSVVVQMKGHYLAPPLP